MTKVPKILIVAVFAVLAGAIGIAAWLFGAEDEHVIATVDGYEITQTVADARLAGFDSVHGDLEAAFGPEFKSVILQSLVDDAIIYIEAERRDIAVQHDQVDGELADVRRMVEAQETWDEWLEGNNATEDELRRRIRLQLLGPLVYNALTDGIEPSDDEVLAYYEEHLEDFEGIDGEPRPLLEVRNSIEATLGKDARDLAYSEWLAQRRVEVKVEVTDDAWK